MEIGLAIGGALLSPVFQMLLEKLRSSDLLNYARQADVLDELRKWNRLLMKIDAVLEDAEEKQMTSRAVQIWVNELRNLAYDVEDILDEFATEVLRRKVEADENAATTSKLRKLIPTCCVGLNLSTVKFDDGMMSKIKSISKKFDEIMEQKDLLNLGESAGKKTNQSREPLGTISFVTEAKVYGREKDRKEVLEMLKAEATDGGFSVISIVGMGGLGKTTLTQLIYNDGATKEFDFKSWVSVGEDFDVLKITKSILELSASNDNNLNSLLLKLKEKLSRKKFLIVLDDVWTKDYDRWTLFCAAFESGAQGSKIIVTTRDQNVSSMMGAAQTYFLKQLSYDECFSVFAQHALGATNFDNHLDFKAMAEEIVKRCKGLPLAAKALGGLLRGKLNHKLWERVLQSNIWEGEETNILPALRVSYYHLPPHLKRCFAYCAMFPDEYEFDKDELVLLWMAEGFLQKPRKNQLTEDLLGHEYFDELLSRSFFQVSNQKESSYVMHDLMRDLARSVSQEASFNLDQWNHAKSLQNDQRLAELVPAKSFETVRHSSFSRVLFDTSQRFQVCYEMKKLRTLLSLPILPGYARQYLSRSVLHDLVPKLKCLRVLSLAGYQLVQLPSSVGTLKLLRYLDLSRTRIVQLPASICLLLNLQTLKLIDCEDLMELPVDIDNLINLRHLDIRGTANMKWMPLQIGNLANLCTLTKFIVGDDSRLHLRELKKFPHLKGELHIKGLQNVVKIEDAEITNLKGKQGLDKLVLEWARDCDDLHNSENAAQVLKLLQPHTNVKSLGIAWYGGAKFPSWLGDPSFNKMVDVKLEGCHQITSLPPLGQLPFLRVLHIEDMPEVKEMGVEFYGNGSASFHSLENFHIEGMSKLTHWPPRKFPKLQQLLIRNCPALVGKVPSCISSLREFTIEGCQEVVLRSVCDLTSLATLEIGSIEDLVSLEEMHLEGSTALKELSIRDCDKLAHLWQDGTDAHNNVLSLISLKITSCGKLTSLVEGEEGLLPRNLQKLKIRSCNVLENLTNGLHSLTSLRDLTISGCPKLASLPATGLPHSLENLCISSCDSLEALCEGTITNMPSHLKTLRIKECRSLKSLYLPIDALANSLSILEICYCTNPLLDSICNLHLMELVLHGCSELESFPE